MSIHSKRLGGPVQLTTAADQTLGTVPTGKVWSIKCVVFSNTSGAAAAPHLGIGGTGTGQTIMRPSNLATATDLVRGGLAIVMNEGEVLKGRCNTGVCDVVVSGFEFDA